MVQISTGLGAITHGHHGNVYVLLRDFMPPRSLGRMNAGGSLVAHFGQSGHVQVPSSRAERCSPKSSTTVWHEQYLDGIAVTAVRINSRNSSIFWESGAISFRPQFSEAKA
jgi:hypothetical protein